MHVSAQCFTICFSYELISVKTMQRTACILSPLLETRRGFTLGQGELEPCPPPNLCLQQQYEVKSANCYTGGVFLECWSGWFGSFDRF